MLADEFNILSMAEREKVMFDIHGIGGDDHAPSPTNPSAFVAAAAAAATKSITRHPPPPSSWYDSQEAVAAAAAA